MKAQPEQLLKQIKEGQMQIKAYQAIVDAKKELLEKYFEDGLIMSRQKYDKQLRLLREKNMFKDKINVQDKTFPNIKNLKQIEEKMEKINNEQLKTSLNNFLTKSNLLKKSFPMPTN